MKSEVVLIVHATSFQDFQPMCSWSINVTDRWTQTDRQTTCNRNTVLCTIVHRTVKLVIILSSGNGIKNESMVTKMPTNHVNCIPGAKW